MEDDSDELSDIEMLEDINQDHTVDNLNLTFNSEDHSIFNEKNLKNTLQTSNISNAKTDEPVCIKDKFPYKHVHSGFCENLSKDSHIYSNGNDVKGNFHATAEFLCPCSV